MAEGPNGLGANRAALPGRGVASLVQGALGKIRRLVPEFGLGRGADEGVR